MPEAWVVTEPEEGYSEVVFAEDAREALRLGAELFKELLVDDGLDAEILEVWRAPEFDRYAEDSHVPLTALFENGWLVMCKECGTPTSPDCGGLVTGENIYCEACKREVAERAERA